MEFVSFDLPIKPRQRSPGLPIPIKILRWVLLVLFGCTVGMARGDSHERPNILWIIVEDMSPHFSCYGESTIRTPKVDALAQSGIRFSRAFVTAPICSISRSALITGHYQTSLGVQNHRSSVPGHPIHLPKHVRLTTELFHEHGYLVNNLTWEDFLKPSHAWTPNTPIPVAKTDYNFEWEESKSYDNHHWTQRKAEQPFFVQIQLHGGKFRGQAPLPAWSRRVEKELGSVTTPEQVHLPPYLPDDPILRADWAQYLDCVRYTDYQVGTILERLRSTGDLGNTVVFFMTDHGISHVRNKQFLYDGGTHVPLIIAGPRIPAETIRDDLVEHIDLAATSLALAGIPKPSSMQSQDILASDYQPRQATFAARDRADETVDWIRSVRTDQFKYIRNGFPDRPYLQPNAYKDSKAILQVLRQLHRAGKLDDDQSRILAESRPIEELYDLPSDPHELHNLASDPMYASILLRMRQRLLEWQEKTGDRDGPESEEVYQIEVAGEHAEGGKGNPSAEYRANVERMKKWRLERPFRPLTP